MTYRTEKNDRRHRRNAKLLTALIALTIFAVAAYSGGFLDQWVLDFMGPAGTPVVEAPVAAVGV